MSATEVSRMPKVTLYVKDADAPIWERARQFAGDSLSSVVSRALATYVKEREAQERAEGELERRATTFTLDVRDDGPSRKIRFRGVLACAAVQHAGHHYDAYATTSGKIIVIMDNGDQFWVYDDYADFLEATDIHELGAAVAEVLGEEWIEEIE